MAVGARVTITYVLKNEMLSRISERRIAEACRLLVETDLAVEKVGRRVGYVGAGYFVRSFRRAHGATPLGWRRAGRP